MEPHRASSGFTLIEILVIVGITAILAAVVVVALNPARQFAQARNSQRWSNVNTLISAISQRRSDNGGYWPAMGACAALPSAFTAIGSGSGNFNLVPCLTPTYLSTIVTDPSVGSAASTGYQVMRSSTGRITVSAPHAELDEVISVSR